MAKEPLKIDPANVPVAAKTQTQSNEEFAKAAAAEFDALKKSLKLSTAHVPPRISAQDLPRKRYHVGCVPNSPHTVMYVGNVDFPLISAVTYPGSDKTKPGTVIECMGTIKEFTDEEARDLVERSAWESWKFRGKSGEVNPSRRWECKRLIDIATDKDGKKAQIVRNPFEPGASLLASFIYIRPMEDGEQLRPGVKSLEGQFMPIPETLYPDPKAATAAA